MSDAHVWRADNVPARSTGAADKGVSGRALLSRAGYVWSSAAAASASARCATGKARLATGTPAYTATWSRTSWICVRREAVAQRGLDVHGQLVLVLHGREDGQRNEAALLT